MNSNPYYALSKWAFTRLCAVQVSPGCGLVRRANGISEGQGPRGSLGRAKGEGTGSEQTGQGDREELILGAPFESSTSLCQLDLGASRFPLLLPNHPHLYVIIVSTL